MLHLIYGGNWKIYIYQYIFLYVYVRILISSISLKSLHFILFCQGHVLQAKKNLRIMDFCFLSLMKNYFQQAFMHREKKYTHIIFSSNFLSKSKFAISFSPIFPHLTKKKGKKKKLRFHEIAKCNLSIAMAWNWNTNISLYAYAT